MTRHKISVRAMVLRFHYTRTFVHSLDDLKNHPVFGKWWDELNNHNRTYVLTGRR